MKRKNALKVIVLFFIVSIIFLIVNLFYSSILTCNNSFWKLGECNDTSETEELEYEPVLDVLMQNNT